MRPEEHREDTEKRVSRRAFVGGGGAAIPAAARGAPPRTQAAGKPPEPGPRPADAESSARLFCTSGVINGLAVQADVIPVRSECGIGALMPWADRLWMVTYVAHNENTGAGTGLYEIDADLSLRKRPESVVGTYANRLIHSKSNQLIIGPHVIDAAGNVRTIESIQGHRLTATMEHLEDRANKVYFLTMEGLLFEADVHTLQTRLLFDLIRELSIPREARPHFKGGYTAGGRVVVANNTYDEPEYDGTRSSGRLAEWDGRKWTILETNPFNEVTGRKSFGNAIYATGWDKASAILCVYTHGKWLTYRLPKATHAMDQYWLTEWPRIREVESERMLMDCHGMFYELSPLAYDGRIWGVRPISTHLRIIPDFCSYRGYLVLAGDHVAPIFEGNHVAGQPQSGLWFGKTDDLWQFGKPKGWGGPWWDKRVQADEPSDPYLMTGFDQKVLHLYHDADAPVEFRIEVDFLGNGTWKTYDTLRVPAKGYVHHEFPAGFSAHWVRVIPGATCTATAWFVYT